MIARGGRFVVVAAGGFVVQIASVWLLAHTAHLSAAPATMAGVSLAVVHNFQWHRWWTWRDRPVRGAAAVVAFWRFVLANGLVSMTGNTMLAIALVDVARLDVVVANAVAVAVCGAVNYALADRMVFTRANRHAGRPRGCKTRPFEAL